MTNKLPRWFRYLLHPFWTNSLTEEEWDHFIPAQIYFNPKHDSVYGIPYNAWLLSKSLEEENRKLEKIRKKELSRKAIPLPWVK